jgi:hypothetical protein
MLPLLPLSLLLSEDALRTVCFGMRGYYRPSLLERGGCPDDRRLDRPFGSNGNDDGIARG